MEWDQLQNCVRMVIAVGMDQSLSSNNEGNGMESIIIWMVIAVGEIIIELCHSWYFFFLK